MPKGLLKVIGIDTNVLVRYIVEDDFEQAVQARQLIENVSSVKNPAFISLLVLCELVWVLKFSYKCDRQQIAVVLENVFLTESFVFENHEVAWVAFHDYTEGSADFADCLIARLNQQNDCSTTYTFDKKAAKLANSTLLKAEIL